MKNPELGQVKTRLSKSVGDDGALKIYQALLAYTRRITQELECAKLLYYSSYIDEKDEWDACIFEKHLQQGEDFGLRMYNAFNEAFENYNEVVIIGSDCFELTPVIIGQAFEMLDDYDLVIGPAKDGGYYLLGMKELRVELFQNKHWSTSVVYEETMGDVEQLGLSVFNLPMLADIDTKEDLDRSGLLKLELE